MVLPDYLLARSDLETTLSVTPCPQPASLCGKEFRLSFTPKARPVLNWIG